MITHYPRYSPHEYNRLMDAAKLRAGQLRREAIRDFWSSCRAACGTLLAKLASRRSTDPARPF